MAAENQEAPQNAPAENKHEQPAKKASKKTTSRKKASKKASKKPTRKADSKSGDDSDAPTKPNLTRQRVEMHLEQMCAEAELMDDPPKHLKGLDPKKRAADVVKDD